MNKNKKVKTSILQMQTIRLSRAHFFLVGAYAIFVLLLDAWKLATPDTILNRWMLVGFLLAINATCWFAAKQAAPSDAYYKLITWVLIIVDIFFAAFNVFTQRGMASRAVLLFMIPIVISTLLGRVAIFTTTMLVIAAYLLSVIRYFFLHPSEGYKVEMYSDIIFYSLVFFIVAELLWLVISRNRNAKIQ